MILVDTSVWIDHFKQPVGTLEGLIRAGRAACHPFVTGELAVGDLRDWETTVSALGALPQAGVAPHGEFLRLIANARLAATGLGFVDVHLLASCQMAGGTQLWSRDERLARYAADLGLGWLEA